MSAIKQRKKGSADSKSSVNPSAAPTAPKKGPETQASIASVLFLLIFGPAFVLGLSWYFTNSFTFGLTMEHLRDPNKLMASFHETLKKSGIPNFHHGESVSGKVDLSTGEVENKWGDANKGTEQVAKFQSSKLRIFTPKELEQYNGEGDRPVFLGVKGRVYDVTIGKAYYGPEGMYAVMGAKDATLYLATGCSDDDCVKEKVPDMNINSASDEILSGADSWIKTYNSKYTLMGFIKGRYERWNWPEAATLPAKKPKAAAASA